MMPHLSTPVKRIQEKHNLKRLPPCFLNEGKKWDYFLSDESQDARSVSFIFGLSLSDEWEAKYLAKSKCWIIREIK